jgi:hypothetical protein
MSGGMTKDHRSLGSPGITEPGGAIPLRATGRAVPSTRARSQKGTNTLRAPPWLCVVAVLVLGGPLARRASAQETANEDWPEVDVYAKLNAHMRVYVMAARSKDRDTDSASGEFGPNLDFFLKSIRGRSSTSPDAAKRKYLMLRVGYRFLPNPNTTAEHRGVIELSPRYYLPKSFLVVNRNRIDLRGKETFSWRYRNRLSLERDVRARGIAFTPYARSEAFYDVTSAKWARFTYTAGVVFPFASRFEIEPSYERQVSKTGQPNYVNGLGLTLSLYF